MLEYGAKAEDPIVSFDGRQSEVAAELQRGVCRALRALGCHGVASRQWPPRTLWRCEEAATF